MVFLYIDNEKIFFFINSAGFFCLIADRPYTHQNKHYHINNRTQSEYNLTRTIKPSTIWNEYTTNQQLKLQEH